MDSGITASSLGADLAAGLEVFADSKRPAIRKVRYSHDAMIDLIVENPWVSQGELARTFGYTEGWVSQIIASDAFQGRLAQRKNDLVDPSIRATVEERFKGLVARSIEILMRKLERPADSISDDLALKALEISSKAAGYGARVAPSSNIQFVVQIPQKAESAEAWVEAHAELVQEAPRLGERVALPTPPSPDQGSAIDYKVAAKGSAVVSATPRSMLEEMVAAPTPRIPEKEIP